MQKTSPRQAGRTDAAMALVHLALIALAVLGWLLVIDVRTDLATGWVDSAIYHALFLDAWAVQERFGDVYWLSRWPWVLTGNGLYSILPPAQASFVLTFVTSWLFGSCAYVLMRQFASPWPAVAAAILASCNLYVAQTASAGYPSIAAVAFLMAGAALSMAGNRRDSLWLIALGGLAYGLAAMTHSFAVMVGFFLHLTLLVSRLGQKRWLIHLRNEAVVVLAASIVLPVSVAILRWMGSSEAVFQTLMSTSRRAFQGQGEVFRKGVELMIHDAGGYIVLAAGAVALVASWLLAGQRLSAIPRPHRVLHVVFLVMLGLGLTFDYGLGGASLDYGFYQVFFTVWAILQFGLLLDRVTGQGGRALLPLAVAVATIAAVWVVLEILDLGISTWRAFAGMAVLTMLVALATLAVLWRARLGAMARWAVAAFVVAATTAGGFSRYTLMAHTQGEGGAPGIETVAWAMAMAETHTSPEAPLFVAYDRGSIDFGPTYPISNDRWYFIYRGIEYDFTIFDTIAGASLWDRGLVATTLDDFTAAELRRVLSYQSVAVVMVMWQEGADPTNEVRRMIEAEELYTFESVRGVYRRPGAIPFNYSIVDVILPEPAVN